MFGSLINVFSLAILIRGKGRHGHRQRLEAREIDFERGLSKRRPIFFIEGFCVVAKSLLVCLIEKVVFRVKGYVSICRREMDDICMRVAKV